MKTFRWRNVLFGTVATLLAEMATAAGTDLACIQVIAWAKNPQSGECRMFPTPCDIPAGWVQVRACPAPSAADIEGIWSVRWPAQTSDMRFLSVRHSGATSVLLLLNAWGWNAYVTPLEGNRLRVISFDGNGYNQWAVVFESEKNGIIVGERCIPGHVGRPLPTDSVATQGAAATDGGGVGTPTAGSTAPDGSLYPPFGHCRVPEGVHIPIEKLF